MKLSEVGNWQEKGYGFNLYLESKVDLTIIAYNYLVLFSKPKIGYYDIEYTPLFLLFVFTLASLCFDWAWASILSSWMC